MENSPNDSPLQYRMFDEYNLALRSMSLTANDGKLKINSLEVFADGANELEI